MKERERHGREVWFLSGGSRKLEPEHSSLSVSIVCGRMIKISQAKTHYVSWPGPPLKAVSEDPGGSIGITLA